jgi:hypothetical protein
MSQAINFVRCIWSQGVADFPRPAVVKAQIVFSRAPGIGRKPDFLSAQNACGYLLGGKPVESGGDGC